MISNYFKNRICLEIGDFCVKLLKHPALYLSLSCCFASVCFAQPMKGEEDVPGHYPGKPPSEVSQAVKDHFETNSSKIDKTHPTFKALANLGESMKEKIASYATDLGFKRSSSGLEQTFKNENACLENRDLYCPIIFNIFDTNTLISSIASEPLFLENKQALSLEMRPFYSRINQSSSREDYNALGHQLGGILGIKTQKASYFFSGHLLYSYSELDLIKNNRTEGHNIILGITGGLSRKYVGIDLTFLSGINFSKMNRGSVLESSPKTLFCGLSPLLVLYPKFVPIDFFVGGEAFYVYQTSFDEKGKGGLDCTISYPKDTAFLFKVKMGPSHTLKKETETRLYQFVVSLAAVAQSHIIDTISFVPKILFESQGKEKRGGWLLQWEGKFSDHTKNYTVAYGLRF